MRLIKYIEIYPCFWFSQIMKSYFEGRWISINFIIQIRIANLSKGLIQNKLILLLVCTQINVVPTFHYSMFSLFVHYASPVWFINWCYLIRMNGRDKIVWIVLVHKANKLWNKPYFCSYTIVVALVRDIPLTSVQTSSTLWSLRSNEKSIWVTWNIFVQTKNI